MSAQSIRRIIDPRRAVRWLSSPSGVIAVLGSASLIAALNDLPATRALSVIAGVSWLCALGWSALVAKANRDAALRRAARLEQRLAAVEQSTASLDDQIDCDTSTIQRTSWASSDRREQLTDTQAMSGAGDTRALHFIRLELLAVVDRLDEIDTRTSEADPGDSGDGIAPGVVARIQAQIADLTALAARVDELDQSQWIDRDETRSAFERIEETRELHIRALRSEVERLERMIILTALGTTSVDCFVVILAGATHSSTIVMNRLVNNLGLVPWAARIFVDDALVVTSTTWQLARASCDATSVLGSAVPPGARTARRVAIQELSIVGDVDPARFESMRANAEQALDSPVYVVIGTGPGSGTEAAVEDRIEQIHEEVADERRRLASDDESMLDLVRAIAHGA